MVATNANSVAKTSSPTVIIVGGGPAGAATALQLARRGVASCVLEASSDFPAKIGETLPPSSAALLQKLGLAQLLQDPAHLPCYGNEFVWGQAAPQEKLFFSQTQAHGWHLARDRFEAALAARVQSEALVTWQMACKMLRAQLRGDAQTPWQVEVEQDGQHHLLQARFLVDASGRSAKIARLCGSERRELDNLIGLASCYHLPQAIALNTRIEAVANGWWYAAPLSGNRLMTVLMTDADLLDKKLRSASGYWQALQETQLIRTLLPATAPAHANAPMTRLASSSFLSEVAGENWLAVGDAAYAYDPISSYGITSAIGAGFYAGNAVADGLLGRADAMPAYRQVLAQAYTQYWQMLQHQYAQEQRWPDAPFWQRRQVAAPTVSAA